VRQGPARREHSILQWHFDGFGMFVLRYAGACLSQVQLAYVSLGVMHQMVYFNIQLVRNSIYIFGRDGAMFRDINFRYTDAQEERLHAPELIDKAFVDIENILEEIEKPEKFLVVGPKGAGKSALSSKLQIR
jgi:ABC-type multidrug transport system fused ATPase/permease subunit